MRGRHICAAALAVLALACAPAAATTVVYDNSTNFTGYIFLPSAEAGDQITLAGTARSVTDFAFAMASIRGTVCDVTVRFYANDGNDDIPGTLLHSQTLTDIVLPQATVVWVPMTVPGPGVTVPDTFTWTADIAGGYDSNAALAIFDPPTVGSSVDYLGMDFFWYRAPDWDRWYFPGGELVANFGATLQAEDTNGAVPEPLTAGAFAIAALGVARYLRRRNRASALS